MRTMACVAAFLFALLGLIAPASAVTVLSGNASLTTGDSTETGRVFRNGVASTWAAPKSYPGAFDSLTHFYDLLTVNFAPNATQTVYYQIGYTNLDNATFATPFSVAHLNTFDPTNIATGYLGDSGQSSAMGSNVSYQVIVPTGNQLLVLFEDVRISPTTSTQITHSRSKRSPIRISTKIFLAQRRCLPPSHFSPAASAR
jgi:hypothetical protein